jgi:hypothetical protein
MRRLAKALVMMTALLGLSALHAQARAENRSRVLCYTLYDSDYFYAAVSVQKPNLAGKQAKSFGDPVQDDAVAVFLQTEDAPVGPQRSARSIEMAVSVAGGAQLYRGAKAESLQVPEHGPIPFLKTPDGTPVPFKYAVTVRGQINQPGGDNTGYTVEMAIPWIELGGPPQVGRRMRFNVVSYSAAPGSSPVLSLSPGVKTPQDVQNPSLWTEIVFVDAPVRTVAAAPGAKVCARVFTSHPIIDGAISEGEWHTLTAFGFEENPASGASVAITPTIAAARVRPAVTLRRARPPILPPSQNNGSGHEPAQPHVPQPLPRLTFTLYNYDFQADPRKAAPLISPRTPEGASLFATHPLEGSGPWMTYDSVDWQRSQLVEMRRAGIDIVLPVYRANVAAKQNYAQRGLITLAGALRHLARAGRDYPLVGLYLDTASLADSKGGRPDLRDPAAQALLYAAVRDFFINIPRPFRAAIPLNDKNGGGIANIVVLSSGAAFAGLDQSFTGYLRSRFAADFGADLLILGGSDFKPGATLDGYVNDTRGRGFQMDESGWIRASSLGVGFDETLHSPIPAPGKDGEGKDRTAELFRSRQDGETYQGEWKQALAKKADWIFLDGWNDFAIGAEIAPTMEYGVVYGNLTRMFTRAFAGTGQMRASFVTHTIPTHALAGSRYAVVLRVLNAGTIPWTPDVFSLTYRWERAGGGPAGQSQSVPLPDTVLPGQAVSVSFSLEIPGDAGAYSLRVDVAQVSKKGDITALFSGLGSVPLAAPVRVVGANDPSLLPYAASLVSTDLPTTLEAGGTYTARVTLRNDGAKVWNRAGGGRIAARVWRYVSPINSTAEKEAEEPMEMADASAELPADVAPGRTVTVSIPITFSREDDAPLPAWSQSDNWVYQMRWEFSANEQGSEGAVTLPETFALVDADIGAQFTLDKTPPALPGDRRMPVKLGLRNNGPQTWRKDVTRVGYHWYYLDGVEAVWQDETTPLTQDIEPGGEVSEMLVWITAPPCNGTYWLVWDLKIGDTWASTLPGARVNQTIVRQIEVVDGKLSQVDLANACNLAGVTEDTSLSDGDFDGSGRTLPAELIPPFASGATAPSTLWLPQQGSGLESSRRISFRWGSKGDKEKNIVQCVGQRLPVGNPRKAEAVRAVHFLAAATKADVLGGFTLIFEDGTQQYTSFPFSRWDAPPKHGEEVAFLCRYSHERSGDAIGKPVALYHYIIRVTEKKKLAAILLPNAPEIKIAAITLEK